MPRLAKMNMLGKQMLRTEIDNSEINQKATGTTASIIVVS